MHNKNNHKSIMIRILILGVLIAGIYMLFKMANHSVQEGSEMIQDGPEQAVLDTSGTTETRGDTVSHENTHLDHAITNPVYDDETLGLKVVLPESWGGYTFIETSWEASVFDPNADNNSTEHDTVTGLKLIIRHPDYSEESPRQDIPILVLTHEQWSQLSEESADPNAISLHIGAAPVGPSLLAENDEYVFALPARYNFEYLEGYEEVETILSGGAVTAY